MAGAQLGSRLGGPHGTALGSGAGAALGAEGTDKLMSGDVGGAAASAGKKHGKKVGAAAAGMAIQPALQMLILLALLNWMKSFFFMLAAFITNLGKIIWAMIKAAVKAIVHHVVGFFSSIGHSIAGFVGFGGSSAAHVVGAGIAGATSAMVATAAVTLAGVSHQTTVRDDGVAGDVQTSACAPGSIGTPISVTTGKTERANAKKIYTVLAGMGMSNANIAGILGNWTRESRMDPTAVQGVGGEPYVYGPKKKDAINSGTKLGIGLGQWTGVRNTMLQKYAKKHDKHWYGLGVQLSFLTDGDVSDRVKVVQNMIAHSQGTPGKAARYFHAQWEGSADKEAGIARRVAAAKQWYGLMSSWDDGSIAPIEPLPIDDPVDNGGGDTAADGCSTVGFPIGPGLPKGSAQDLAAKILPYVKSGALTCAHLANCSDIRRTAQGKPVGGNCQVEGLNRKLVAIIYGLLKNKQRFTLSSLCSNHSPDPMAHSAGASMDLAIINGVVMNKGGAGSGAWNSFIGNKKLQSFYTALAAVAPSPKDFIVNQAQCYDHDKMPASMSGHHYWGVIPGYGGADPCTHQHIGVDQYDISASPTFK